MISNKYIDILLVLHDKGTTSIFDSITLAFLHVANRYRFFSHNINFLHIRFHRQHYLTLAWLSVGPDYQPKKQESFHWTRSDMLRWNARQWALLKDVLAGE